MKQYFLDVSSEASSADFKLHLSIRIQTCRQYIKTTFYSYTVFTHLNTFDTITVENIIKNK